MATKGTKQNGGTPVVPDFKDVDKDAVQAAQAALAGGRQNPLKPAKNARVSEGKNGARYTRWTERIVISQAYRSVTPSGLMDVVIIGKIRQGEGNNGQKLFSHFYLNLQDDISEGHVIMNERSNGALITLLTATKYMPAGGALKGTLLNKMFPSKGQPGTQSPLAGKLVVANVVQEYSQQIDRKTKKAMTDEQGDPIMQKRDSGESFLPDTGSAGADGEGDESEE